MGSQSGLSLQSLLFRSVPHTTNTEREKKKSITSVASVSTSNNANFKLENLTANPANKITKCKPVTLTSRSPNTAHQRKKYFFNSPFSQGPAENQSDHLLTTNFHLEQDDLFNELNSSIDSFDSIHDIDFCYDDPFAGVREI